MLRINRVKKELVKLDKRSLADSGLTEPHDLQRMILTDADVFFSEIGEDLLVIGEEVRPTEFVEDRIDLLGLDQDGSLVVIELKRGSHKLHLLQALAYAGMVSKWEGERIIAERQRFMGASKGEVEEEMEEFLVQGARGLNDSQRIILIAEDFEYEVLVTAEWLTEAYGLDIRCHRLALSIQDDAEFLTCSRIYPPPEVAQHARRRRRGGDSANVPWSDWDEALSKVNNAALVAFFRKELARGRENHLGHRDLFYRVNDRRMFFVGARKNSAYVWQYRRFPNDEQYWKQKIGPHLKPEPVNDGKSLRFHLSSETDFESFLDVVEGDLTTVTFSDEVMGDETDGEEEM